MKALHCVFVAALCVVGLFGATELRASAATLATFVVNSTGDQHDDAPGNGVCHTTAGTCTLRAAIEETDALAGADRITFGLTGGGNHVISANSALPPITDQVDIDGTTQTNCAAFPCIVLDGKFAGNATGLDVKAGGSVIRGLVINQFKGAGILLETQGGDQIYGNFIGTDVTGKIALANSTGVSIQSGATNNIIGSTIMGARNVISGNKGDGVMLNGSTVTQNTIQDNFIGTDVSGVLNLGNGGSGVRLRNGAAGNIVGGPGGGEGNRIGFNANDGVLVGSNSSSDMTRRNNIRGNAIFSNGGLGIDLGGSGVTHNDLGDNDTGPNNFQNFPKVKSAVSATKTIKGKVNSTPNTGLTVEIFSNSACDASGFGEGKTQLFVKTVTTDGSGNASFTVVTTKAFAAGNAITATATDPSGNTSEFGKCKTAS